MVFFNMYWWVQSYRREYALRKEEIIVWNMLWQCWTVRQKTKCFFFFSFLHLIHFVIGLHFVSYCFMRGWLLLLFTVTPLSSWWAGCVCMFVYVHAVCRFYTHADAFTVLMGRQAALLCCLTTHVSCFLCFFYPGWSSFFHSSDSCYIVY